MKRKISKHKPANPRKILRKFQTVRKNPDDYKICNICLNINLAESEKCWLCGSEDFDYSEKRIFAKVNIESERLKNTPNFERHNYIQIG